MPGEDKPKKWTFVLFCRFYIESISFLKDKTTVELFFLNAKACVHKVRNPLALSSTGQLAVAAGNGLACVFVVTLCHWHFLSCKDNNGGSTQVLSGEENDSHAVSTTPNIASIPRRMAQCQSARLRWSLLGPEILGNRVCSTFTLIQNQCWVGPHHLEIPVHSATLH